MGRRASAYIVVARRGHMQREVITMSGQSIPAGAFIGHVHLKVADLERAVRFYRDLLGFDLMARFGDGAAFLSAGD